MGIRCDDSGWSITCDSCGYKAGVTVGESYLPTFYRIIKDAGWMKRPDSINIWYCPTCARREENS